MNTLEIIKSLTQFYFLASYQKIEAEFFRNEIVLLDCYPPNSFVLIWNAQQIGTGRVTILNTVHKSTMHAQTIQPV